MHPEEERCGTASGTLRRRSSISVLYDEAPQVGSAGS